MLTAEAYLRTAPLMGRAQTNGLIDLVTKQKELTTWGRTGVGGDVKPPQGNECRAASPGVKAPRSECKIRQINFFGG
jgi:hypothetical protein